MMSYSTKVDRRRENEEIWQQETEWPPKYNLTRQLLHLHQQNPTLQSCYPAGIIENELYNEHFYKTAFPPLTSPISASQDYTASGPGYFYQDYPQNKKKEIVDNYFEEEIFDMEDSFRSALMRYFSQVDQEKQGMSADLRKIKEDFFKYEEEAKKMKIENNQKGKIIRKLTENGKLFVKEIERLKDELREVEAYRRSVVIENNDLQKRIKLEKNAIPHLESELKSLAEENQYLKLLAEDTQKLNEQEEEIQKYAHQLEEQQKFNQEQESDLKKHDFAIEQLTKINRELCSKVNELSGYKNATNELHELQVKHREFLMEKTSLETKYRKENNRSLDLNQRVINLETDLKCVNKANCELRETCYHFERECEQNANLVKILELKVNNLQNEQNADVKESQEKDEHCRDMQSENEELKTQISALKIEISNNKTQCESLIYEDEVRNKEFDSLLEQLQQVEKQCHDLYNQNNKIKTELLENQNTLDSFNETKLNHKQRIDGLVNNLKDNDERYHRMELKSQQQLTREEDLQQEILTHVKRQSGMEQEIALTSTTIETLRKSNENCDQQRVKLQQELLFAQDTISTLNRKVTEKSESSSLSRSFEFRSSTIDNDLLERRYKDVESDRNRLRTELLELQNQTSQSRNDQNTVLECNLLQNQLNEFESPCIIQENELSDVKSKYRSYENEIKCLKEELKQNQNKLDYHEKQNNNEFNAFCSSSNEWHVELECSIQNERPYPEQNSQSQLSKPLNNQSQLNEQLDSHSSFINIKRNNSTPDRNVFDERKHDENNIRLINESNDMNQTECMNKSDLIHTLECELASRETIIENLKEENTQLYKNLDEFSEQQNIKIEIITKEKRKLYLDLQDIVEEISTLRQSERNLEQIVKEKEVCIEELEQNGNQLERELSGKEELAKELESLVEELQSELNKIVDKNLDEEQEDRSEKVTRELQENLSITELHVKKLQRAWNNRDTEILNLKDQIKERQIESGQRKAENLNQSDAEYQQFLKDRVQTLEKALLEKEHLRDKIALLNSYSEETKRRSEEKEEASIGQINCAQSAVHEKQLKEKINEIEKLGNENEAVRKELNNLKYSTPLNSNSETFDTSFQDENLVSKQKYLDLADQLETKKQQILDYEEHIQLLQLSFSESPVPLEIDSQDTSGFESMRGRPEKCEQQIKYNLQLPTPNQTVKSKVLHQRRSSLPPIPVRTTSALRPRCNSSDRSKDSIEKDRIQTKMGKDTSITAEICGDELRNKLVKLNLELLKKKMEVSAFQEELKLNKRKLARSEESYRNVVSKNESLEYEIEDNRRKIIDVQTKQNANDSYDLQRKRDVTHLKQDLQDLEESYDKIREENEILVSKIQHKDDMYKNIQQKVIDVEQEVHHWKHSSEVLENECQSLATCIEKREDEIVDCQNEIEESRLNLEVLEKEKESWKKDHRSNSMKFDELQSKNESLKDEIFIKEKLNKKLKEQSRIVEREREIQEMEIKQNMVKLKSLEKTLNQSEIEREEIENETTELRLRLEICEKEKDGWRKNRQIYDYERDELNAEIESLKEEIILKSKSSNSLNERLNSAEEELEMFKLKQKEYYIRTKTLEEQLIHCENDKSNLEREYREVKINMEVLENDKDIWRNKKSSTYSQLNEFDTINESLQRKRTDELVEQMNTPIEEQLARIKSLKERLSESERDRKGLENENERLMLMVHDGKYKDLTSEKDEAISNARYLHQKIDDLTSIIKQKDEKLNKYFNESNDGQIIQLTDELKFSKLELKQKSKQLNKEIENIGRLEKLNSEMNRENKRLMHELIKFQDRLKSLSEENEIQRGKLSQSEKEQKNLDNLLTKTQISNSELLDQNKSTVEELRMMKNKVNQLVQELEDKNEEHNELERKLLLTENELHVATEKLSTDNSDLTREVHNSRQITRELEAILDQGQLDFDEMDVQLEKLRHENVELDQKLHEAFKKIIKEQSENEESKRKLFNCVEEIEDLKTEIVNERKELELCSREKDEIAGQLQECKSNEHRFEERLTNEIKNKEKIQDDILKLQSELIDAKTNLENLRSDVEAKNKMLTEKMHILQKLEISQTNLKSEKDDLESKLYEKIKALDDYEQIYIENNKERDEIEFKYRECLNRIQSLESIIEDEKLSRQDENEEFLSTISNLKRNLDENDILNEKYSYQQINMDSNMKEMLEQNNGLKQKIEELKEEILKIKEFSANEITNLQEKIQIAENRKSQEMIQLKATLDGLENSRGNDISLLRMKLQEVEDLRQKMNEERRENENKGNEIEILKEDIIQLQTDLDNTEIQNSELAKGIEQQKTQILYLEKNKYEVDDDKHKLLNCVKSKDVSLKNIERKNEAEKEFLLAEKQQLEATYTLILQEKDSRCKELQTDILVLKNQIQTIEEIKEENENLKRDLEAILSERKGFHMKLSERTQLQTENYDLRAKADRNQELLNENRMIKQELRDIESKHIDSLNRINRENTALRRNVDELFKKNQDLELNNVTQVRTRPRSTLYFETTTPRFDPVTLTIKPKAASVDNINEVGFEMESFSPMKNGVATSTPTQENHRFSSSIITRAQSADRLNIIKHVQIPPIVVQNITQKMNDNSLENIPLSNRDNQLATGPLVQTLNRNMQNVDESVKRKVDASWNQPQEDEFLQSSIKLNPFFKRDQNTAKKNWKTAVNSTKTNAPGQLPVRSTSLLELSTTAYRFDMRPKSTDIPEPKPTVSPMKTVTIGNEFVNRLKATFEKR